MTQHKVQWSPTLSTRIVDPGVMTFITDDLTIFTLNISKTKRYWFDFYWGI